MTTAALQDHTLARELVLPARARDLARELRAVLRKASDSRRLRTSPGEILQLVKLISEPPPSVAEKLRELELRDNAYCIVGGDKNQERDRDRPHFERDDGAWFDFSITVREDSRRLVLLAYDFEIRFPAGAGTPFLRFDLNLPEHRNEHRELRCHLHPGSDDIIVPAPKMSPTEMLALLTDGLRRAGNRATSRAPTAFEVDWFRRTQEAFSGPRPLLAAEVP